MIIDALLQFSTSQAITAAVISEDYVDLGVARNVGIGENLFVVLTVEVAFTDSGSNSVLDVYAYFDSTSTFTPDNSQKLMVIPAVSAIGTKFAARIQPNIGTEYRYMALFYDPIGSDLTAGTVTASIVKDPDLQEYYAGGFTVF